MARTNTSTGGGGSGTFSNITGTPTTIAYFDALGLGTGDLDHTLLADGTLTLQSTFGDVTGQFYQGTIPSFGGMGGWGMSAANNVTDSNISQFILDGTNSADVGNDSVLITTAQFPNTDVLYQQFIAAGGVFTGVSGAAWNYSQSITGNGCEVLYDDGTTGSQLELFAIGGALTSRDLSSYSTGNPVYAIFGQVSTGNTGTTTRVATGKDIVDYVQTGVTVSTPVFSGAGLDDFTAGTNYTGAYTGNYSITVLGNNANRIRFAGGMTTGTQFNVGEVITGSISGATATVSNGTNDTRVWAYNIVGTFVLGDILTGDQGNVSTAVTFGGLGGGAPDGDLFEVNYTDIANTNIQWFVGGQASPTPVVGIGGVTYYFASPGGHTTGNSWTFTATADYDAKQTVDATGTVFSNNTNQTTTHSQDIPITEKITLSPAQVNDMNSNPVASTIAVPTGYAIQILEIYGRNTYNTTPYATNTTINIAFTSAPTQSLWQQAVLLTETATTIRRFIKTSGSGADVVLPNDSLVITNTSGNPTAGDSDIDVYITYKLIEL